MFTRSISRSSALVCRLEHGQLRSLRTVRCMAASGRHSSSCLPAQPRLYHTTPMTHMMAENSDSHDDFSPQRKEVKADDDVQSMIAQHVKENPVMLYMKGTPSTPMCGFSAQVVAALKAEGVDFSSVNVLDYPSIRDGIKIYSDWPTIPQLYVKGEFIGGCDIVLGMHESGELKELLQDQEQQQK